MRGFIKIFEPYNMVIDALNDSLWVADAINMEKSNNEDLYTHSINVAVYTAYILYFGDSSLKESCNNDTKSVILGALLHDIGYIAAKSIPSHRESFNMTETEKICFENHISLGLNYAREFTDNKIIRNIIKMHHENLNGTGFPQKLEAPDIPKYVRVVSIANAFENYVARLPEEDISADLIIPKLRQSIDNDELNHRFDLTLITTLFDNMSNYIETISPLCRSIYKSCDKLMNP